MKCGTEERPLDLNHRCLTLFPCFCSSLQRSEAVKTAVLALLSNKNGRVAGLGSGSCTEYLEQKHISVRSCLGYKPVSQPTLPA